MRGAPLMPPILDHARRAADAFIITGLLGRLEKEAHRAGEFLLGQ